jgi:HAD superfamily hydrolase (TIGR01549 family)
MKKKLLILDIDGVIIDSKDNMKYSWDAVMSENDIHIQFEQYFKLIGIPFEDIIKKLNLTDKLSEIKRSYYNASMKTIDDIKFYPGILDVLICLSYHGIKLAIVTSKDKDRTMKILKKIPVNFSSIQTPNTEYRGKPNPDHLFLAMIESQVDPKDAVYIGDMLADKICAKRAGIDYIHAKWGYQKIDADIVASSPLDIIDLL